MASKKKRAKPKKKAPAKKAAAPKKRAQVSRTFEPKDTVICARWQDQKRGLPGIPDKHFDHVITDAPYSEYVHEKKWSGGDGKSGPKEKKVTFAPLTLDELRLAAAHIVRVTKGWAIVFCADDDIKAWKDAFQAAGALRWPGCIWTKPNGTPQFRGEGPSQPCEHIVLAWCGEGRPRWNGGGKMGHYDVPIEPSGDRKHETQKPVRLMKNLVLDFTSPGDVIADIYAGAGTTGFAARVCGRHYVLWEIDKKHADAARRWCSRAREQLRIEELLHAARPEAFGKKRKPRTKFEQGKLAI